MPHRLVFLLLTLLAACGKSFTSVPIGTPGVPLPEPQGSIEAVRLSDGLVATISDRTRGAGPLYDRPTGLALDAARNRLLAVNSRTDFLHTEPWALYSVDLTTGNRGTISDATHGSGPLPGPLHSDSAIALDTAGERLFVADYDYLAVVDLASGDRVEVSGSSVGSGPSLEAPRGVALDLANDRAFVADSVLDAVLVVDLATGDRWVLADRLTGGGSEFDRMRLLLDDANDRLLVVSQESYALYAVDLDTGSRTVLSDFSLGRGPSPDSPVDLALDGADGRILVLTAGELLSVDLLGRDLQLLATIDRVTGELSRAFRAFALDAAAGRVLVATVRVPGAN